MTGTSHTVTAIPLRVALLAAALLAACPPILAAGPASPAKPAKRKPCAEGQVEIISKNTGLTRCAAMGGITIMDGGPRPILVPEKPAAKPRQGGAK